MARVLAWIAVSVAAGAVACQLLLPERFAVNAPLGNLIFGSGVDSPPPEAFGERIRAAQGLEVRLYADGLPNARMLRFTAAGDLLVSQPRLGRITWLARDRNADGRPDARRALLEGLERPHGMDLREGWLYVAEAGRVARVRFDAAAGEVSGELEPVVTGLPTGGNHWTRTVRFGPDGHLYVSVGSSCNVCEEEDPRRAALLRYRADGSGEEIFASGLRNAVGFDWRPADGALYATDNGRDLLGDDFPPCELNRVVAGGFYGWPYANGDDVPDPDLGEGHEAEIAGALPPVHGFRAHNAPLGITFVRGDGAPEAYRGAALVALHGSWNRSTKDGYKVVSLHWNADGSIQERDLVWGFEREGDVIGRPVDVAEGPDGAFYVSDDYAGALYRVSRKGEAAPGPAAVPAAPRTGGGGAGFDADRVARGRALYGELGCASCHDPARAAPGVVPMALEGLAARYDARALAAFLAAPTPPMPAFPLEPAQRDALAAYLLTTHP